MSRTRLPRLRYWAFLLGACWCLPCQADEPPGRTRNVILITADGLRWQEIFRGADPTLINKENGGITDPDPIKKLYDRDTPEARRKALMPFLWGRLAREGQIFGNRDKGAPARSTNGLKFSYPGYNEIFTGAPDPRIDSNDKNLNPNLNVFEWFAQKPAYQSRVGAVGSWDLYPWMLNSPRSGVHVNAGWQLLGPEPLSDNAKTLNRLMSRVVPDWPTCRNDLYTYEVARELLLRNQPRVFYIGFGDTDEYAHEGRYDRYLQAINQFDRALGELWEEVNSTKGYAGETTFIITTDHGRGEAPLGWKNHGEKVEGADSIWIAVIGPDTPAMGERKDHEEVTQSQVAATMAALLGESDFPIHFPKAAGPISSVIQFPQSASAAR